MVGARVERIVLIGLAGVDWLALGGAMQRRLVPNISRMAGSGLLAPLRTPPPVEGPPGWTTLATGLPPETHGVIGADEAWAGGVRQTSRASWAAPALWERLEQAGIGTAGIGWPGSNPGADWPGLHIDDLYARPSGHDWQDWALPLRCAPGAAREELRALRVHPSDIDAATLAPFVPDLGTVDQERDPALAWIALALAHAATVQAGAVWLLAQNPPARATFIHNGWLAALRTRFDGRAAPYNAVIESGWRFLDGLIARLAQLTGADTQLLLVSPGWKELAGFLLAPGVQPQEPIRGVQAIDIAPTILSRFGLRDPALPGSLVGALAGTAARVLTPAAPREHIPPDAELLAAVAAQGYPVPPQAPRKWRAARATRFGAVLLTRAPDRALAAAETALAIDATDVEALSLKAYALIALERADGLKDIAETLDRTAPGQPWGRMARGAYHALRGETAEAAPLLREAERAEDGPTRRRAGAAWLLLRQADAATRAFRGALEIDPDDASAEIGLSMAALLAHRPVDAEIPLRRVLMRDAGHAAAWTQLAAVLHKQGRSREAKEAEAIVARLG